MGSCCGLKKPNQPPAHQKTTQRQLRIVVEIRKESPKEDDIPQSLGVFPAGEEVRNSYVKVSQLSVNEPSLRKTVWKAHIEDQVPQHRIDWKQGGHPGPLSSQQAVIATFERQSNNFNIHQTYPNITLMPPQSIDDSGETNHIPDKESIMSVIRENFSKIFSSIVESENQNVYIDIRFTEQIREIKIRE